MSKEDSNVIIRPNGICGVCGSSTCRCIECHCTEELCCSMASSVLQSLPSAAATSQQSMILPQTRMNSSLSSDPLRLDSHDNNKNQSLEEEIMFSVNSMSCQACVGKIRNTIQNLGDVIKSVVVELETKTVTVQWVKGQNCNDDDNVMPNRIQDALESLGYSATRLINQPPENVEKTRNHQVADILVSGMTCTMCSRAIENVVGALNGVEQVHVALATDMVHVVWDSNQLSMENIREAIEDIGYPTESVILYPNTKPEKHSADSSISNAAANIHERWQQLNQRQEDKVQKKRLAFLWSLVGTLPILFLTMVFHHIGHSSFLDNHLQIAGRLIQVEALILWILATPVQFIAGFDFYKMTWHNLRTQRLGMDVLVALGTTAAYVYALVGAWNGDDMSAHFFETSVVLISFVLAGKWLQALAVRRTSEALTRLMQLQSKTAIQINFIQGGEQSFSDKFLPTFLESVVPIEQIQKGDIVKVIRGSSIPADGKVIFGAMSVDESMVTGESMPVLKTPGSDVLGGTICVESDNNYNNDGNRTVSVGAVFVEVTGVGSSTALAQIIQLVQDAQTRSVPIQSFVDTVSSIFVPSVCLISFLTYMTWFILCKTQVVPPAWYQDLGETPVTFSLLFGIACLVISCPCALGLATPTAVMVGTGVGAKVGVLMKGGEALEVASRVDSVIFDKTGTLTKGKPVITDFVRFDANLDLTDEDLLWYLGSLERTSEHPLAKAVVSYVETRLPQDYLQDRPFVEPTDFRALTGRGASGIVLDSVKIAAGNRAFAAEQNLVIPKIAEDAMQEMERSGKTAVLVTIDGEVCLVLGLADELKPGAKAAIAYLRDHMHLDVWMVTGDNDRTARAIATQLGLSLDHVISEALPAAKVQQVRRLQEQNHLVAMVGDGINDSPALAQADVGMSVGTAAEIATEASDFVLVTGKVEDVCTALHLSRSIFRRIQVNLLCSLLYNVLGIPLAAGVFYPLVQMRLPPTVAALAMALSSVSVVLSSLSLRFYRPPTVIQRPTRRNRIFWRLFLQDSGDTDDLQQDLLAHDFLSASEITDTTAVIDNRSPREQDYVEII